MPSAVSPSTIDSILTLFPSEGEWKRYQRLSGWQPGGCHRQPQRQDALCGRKGGERQPQDKQTTKVTWSRCLQPHGQLRSSHDAPTTIPWPVPHANGHDPSHDVWTSPHAVHLAARLILHHADTGVDCRTVEAPRNVRLVYTICNQDSFTRTKLHVEVQ